MLEYHAAPRRRLRAVKRAMNAARVPAMWRGARVVPSYWWNGHPNFGDALTPWLLPRYGILPVHRRASVARLAGVGSILEFLPESYDGVILGSGLMEESLHPLPHARALAVRGPLTADLIGVDAPVAFGDPGLLVARHLRRPRSRWRVGLVPHGHHRGTAESAALIARAGSSAFVVNVHQEAAPAVRQIASCDAVISTSLHGLITADSFGIPALWTTMSPPLSGGDFKFRDYEAAVTPGRSRYVPIEQLLDAADPVAFADVADPRMVESLGDGLEQALTEVRRGGPGNGSRL